MPRLLRICAYAVPGICLVWAGYERPGIAVAALGASIGLLISVDHVSGPRTIRLFFATLIARHVPGMAHRLFDAVDGTEPSAVADDRLLDWLLARHVVSSRRWLVWWGIAIGVATGLTITVHDVITVQSGSEGWILPWRIAAIRSGCKGF